MPELPSGTVTLLFTDIEGSTRLLHELGDAYADVLAEHRRLLREAFSSRGGVEVDTQGDAFFYAFARASDALAAAEAGQRALAGGPVRVRMGVHTGEPTVTEEGYVGPDVHLAARVMGAGHGGQVLVSEATARRAGAELRGLGAHRLKDIEGRVQLLQLGDGRFPPLKTLSNSNLPRPPTPLVGRKKELADVLRRLRVDSARLVTVTGPGGIGKTRFALEVAHELVEDLPHGVWFVDLSVLRDPGLVVPTIASALGAKSELAEHVADKRLLLVLDNFEQVVAAAVEVADLLRRCANVQVLVTSREPLRVTGEQAFPLRPLASPPAVELFRQRAEAAAPDFDAPWATLTAIVERLDRLPLALELAAARTRALPAGDLLARLEQRLPLLTSRGRDLPERQRTLRATMEWSHDLLDADEQALFRCLAVFAGGWTLEAAEAVCAADIDVLQSLLEKSLVRRRDGEAGPRYWMLETIREFAAEQLDACGERAAVTARRDAWLRSFVPGLARRVRLYEAEALAVVADELPNVRSALAGALDQGDVTLSAEFLLGVFLFWLMHGHGREAHDAAERWLTLDRAGVDQRALVPGLLATGEIMRFAGDPRRAADLKEELAAALRAHPTEEAFGWQFRPALASVLTDLATLELDWAVEAADAHAREALDRRRASNDPPGAVAHALAGVAAVAFVRRAFDESFAAMSEAVKLWRASGADAELPGALGILAEYSLRSGRADGARMLLLEALEGTRDGSDLPVLLFVLRVTGAHAAVARRPDVAGALLAVTDRGTDEAGVRLRSHRESDLEEELLEPARASDSRAWAEAYEAGRALELDAAYALAARYLRDG